MSANRLGCDYRSHLCQSPSMGPTRCDRPSTILPQMVFFTVPGRPIQPPVAPESSVKPVPSFAAIFADWPRPRRRVPSAVRRLFPSPYGFLSLFRPGSGAGVERARLARAAAHGQPGRHRFWRTSLASRHAAHLKKCQGEKKEPHARAQ